MIIIHSWDWLVVHKKITVVVLKLVTTFSLALYWLANDTINQFVIFPWTNARDDKLYR